MNLLAMALIMGVAMLFMHGQGHHPSGPGTNHRSENLAVSPSDMRDAPESTHNHGQSNCSSNVEIKRADDTNHLGSIQENE